MQSSVTEDSYVAAIEGMVHRGRAWLAEHPNADASVQWNFPNRVWLGASFDQAVELKLVTLQGQAGELCAAMNGESREASVMMMRMAMELLHDLGIKQKAGR